jgi:two-component system, NarL family, nitrate/nitrite response regulator NarL
VGPLSRDRPPVILCDDELMFSEVLLHLLTDEGYDTVQLLGDPTAALEAMRAAGGEALCIVELERRRESVPLEVIAEMTELGTVVILTRARDPRVRARALAAGAHPFLTKDQPATAVLAALARVTDPNAARSGVDPLLGFIAGRTPDPATSFLTAREREVLQALVDGESTAGISERLGVRPSTLRGYIQRVLMKLGVHSRAAAAAVAVDRGLARPSGPPPTLVG